MPLTLLAGTVIVADSTAGFANGAQLLYQAIGAANLRAYVQGQDDAGIRAWRTDRVPTNGTVRGRSSRTCPQQVSG